jgi:hypothetical protein
MLKWALEGGAFIDDGSIGGIGTSDDHDDGADGRLLPFGIIAGDGTATASSSSSSSSSLSSALHVDGEGEGGFGDLGGVGGVGTMVRVEKISTVIHVHVHACWIGPLPMVDGGGGGGGGDGSGGSGGGSCGGSGMKEVVVKVVCK